MAELLHTKLEKAKAEHAAKLKVAGAFTSIPKGAPSPTALQIGAIYFRGISAEPERATRWVRMAHRVLGDQEDPHMGFQLQQCGFLDTLILAFESEQRTDPGPDCGNLYIAGQAFEFVLGDCWLLFTYEVLRTFRSSGRFSALPKAQQDGLNEIFRLVSAARMPIAKHEAAKTRKGKTFVFNAPIHLMHNGLGTMGWRVFDASREALIDILRRPLADALLLCSEGKLTADAVGAISTGGSRELIRIVKT